MTGPSIVFGVTSDRSVALLGKLPERLAREGWDVHVLSTDGPGLTNLRKTGVIACHAIRMSRRPSFFLDLISLVRWIEKLNQIRPEIVSVGTPKAALLGIISGALCGVEKRVYFLRGLRLETETGVRKLALWFFERITAGFATDILAVSNSLREAFLSKRLSKPSKIRVLGSGSSTGVDLTTFRPAREREARGLKEFAFDLGLDPSRPIIGYVGRLHVDKGVNVFTQALQNPPLVNVDFQILIIGNDESEGSFEEKLRGTHKTAIFLGDTTRSEVAVLYRLMTVLCLPTQREGMPNVVLEALASSIPVVTTNATGAVDSVEAGVNGLIVSKSSSNELSEALANVLSDPELRERMSRSARIWVTRRFSEDIVLRHQEKFYAGLTHG